MFEYCDGCYDVEKNIGRLKKLFIGSLPNEISQTMILCKKCHKREMVFRQIRNKNRPEEKPLEIISWSKMEDYAKQ